MTFEKFKETVIEYFSPHLLFNKEFIDKMLKFKEPSTMPGYNYWEVEFTFNDKVVILSNCLHWKVTTKDLYIGRQYIINIGNTINECCDFLWTDYNPLLLEPRYIKNGKV